MAQVTLESAIAACRALVHDTATSNCVRNENFRGVQDGANKVYELAYFPIVMQGFALYLNGTALVANTDYTVDAEHGLVLMAAAPAYADNLKLTYYWNWYKDREYYEFIISAYNMLGFTVAEATSDDPRDVAAACMAAMDGGLLSALKHYVAYEFNIRRANEYAMRFGSSSGGQMVKVDVVTANYRELAKEMKATADDLLERFYKRSGRREAPSATQSTMSGFPPYTPRR